MIVDLPNPNLPGPAVEGMSWEETGPRHLMVTERVGELHVSEGRQWQVARTVNGCDLVLITDLKAEDDGRNRTFVLRAGPLIQQLAQGLLRG